MKYKKCHAHHGSSCKMTAPTDKICGNKSKICMTSRNYLFFNVFFPIFQFLRYLTKVGLPKNKKRFPSLSIGNFKMSDYQ
jgi:hypothetical protein